MTAQPDQIVDDFAPEAADPHCLTAGEADALLAPSPWRRFVAIGDSITQGVGEPTRGYRDLSMADRVAEALGRVQPDGMNYLNVARIGALTAEIAAEQLHPALAFEPDLALVFAGGNDVLQGTFDGAAFEAQYDAMVVALQERGVDVITPTMFDITKASVIPVEYRAPLGKGLARVADRIRAVAARRGTMLIEFGDHPACADDGIYSSDLRHGNRRGHAIAAAALIRELGRRLRNT